MLRLCLIRHGETDWNVEARLQGSTDIPLNAHGIRQAYATAEVLSDDRFDAIYSSDLLRATMTASVIAEAQHQPLLLEPRLRERDLGLLQGLAPADAMEQFPEVYGRLKAKIPDYEPPKGESVTALAARVSGALTSIAAKHQGQTVLAVTHGGVLDIVYRLVMDIDFDEVRTWLLRNSACNWLAHDGGSWRILAWDEHEHLHRANDERGA
jgi:2,3-bisphosphoglycerate-dependent phosphoglycerate mutase